VIIQFLHIFFTDLPIFSTVNDPYIVTLPTGLLLYSQEHNCRQVVIYDRNVIIAVHVAMKQKRASVFCSGEVVKGFYHSFSVRLPVLLPSRVQED